MGKAILELEVLEPRSSSRHDEWHPAFSAPELAALNGNISALAATLPRDEVARQVRRGWATTPCDVPGIEAVDRGFLDMIQDLQRYYFGTWTNSGQLTNWIMSLSDRQRFAVCLAQVAIEVHTETRKGIQDLLTQLPKMDNKRRSKRRRSPGEMLADLWQEHSDRLIEALAWIPPTRGAHLWATARSAAELAEACELPHLAFLVATLPWEEAVDKARAFASSVEILAGLQNEHEARMPETVRDGRIVNATVPALVFAMGEEHFPKQTDAAFGMLQSMVPTREVRTPSYGGSREDRHNDFRQDLRLRLIRLLHGLRQDRPSRLLGRASDGDRNLSHLPNAAERDFQNERATARYRDEIMPEELRDPLTLDADGSRGGSLAPEELSSQESGGKKKGRKRRARVPSAYDIDAMATPSQGPDIGLGLPHAKLVAIVLESFRHTDLERRLLEIMLTEEADVAAKGGIQELANMAGCKRETASRYVSKLRKNAPKIAKALLK
jgi:hypothetical protein